MLSNGGGYIHNKLANTQEQCQTDVGKAVKVGLQWPSKLRVHDPRQKMLA